MSAGKVRSGPAITVTCGCGEVRYLHYGEVWRCEKCGTTWNTNQIPEEEYAALLRMQRRHIIVPAMVLLLGIATVALFIILGRVYAVVLLPFAMFAWFIFVRPIQRRRLARQLEDLPRWQLTPE